MGECMPKEEEEYIKSIQKHAMEATNMTEEEAWEFAFRCWQLGYIKLKKLELKDGVLYLKVNNKLYEIANSNLDDYIAKIK